MTITDAAVSTVRVDGHRVTYRRAGPADAPPVVLLHGGGYDDGAVSWRDVLPDLADEYDVYAPDWPGYGDSAPPLEDATAGGYAAFLGPLLDVLDLDRAALVGISMGGAAAIGFALARPDRVSALVAVDSWGLGSEVPGGTWTVRLVQTPYVLEALTAVMKRSRRVTAAALSGFVAGEPDPELVGEVYERVRADRGTAAYLAFRRAEITADGIRTDYTDRLADLDSPTLFVHGAEDEVVPAAWAERAADRAGADCEIVADAGHLLPRERPEAFLAAVRPFLDAHAR